ncbi:RE1 [Symbiodinium sp. KB8]|nr:RE1 [Symbiodinium sp. KB8]
MPTQWSEARGFRRGSNAVVQCNLEVLRKAGVRLFQGADGVLLADVVPAEAIFRVLAADNQRGHYTEVLAEIGSDRRLHLVRDLRAEAVEATAAAMGAEAEDADTEPSSSDSELPDTTERSAADVDMATDMTNAAVADPSLTVGELVDKTKQKLEYMSAYMEGASRMVGLRVRLLPVRVMITAGCWSTLRSFSRSRRSSCRIVLLRRVRPLQAPRPPGVRRLAVRLLEGIDAFMGKASATKAEDQDDPMEGPPKKEESSSEELVPDDAGRAHKSATRVPRQFRAATHVAPAPATMAAYSDEAPSVPAAGADGMHVCPDCGKGLDSSVRWLLHRAAGTEGVSGFVLIGKGFSLKCEPPLVDCQGNAIHSKGSRLATLEAAGVELMERWAVTPVAQPILAAGKMIKQGWRFVDFDDLGMCFTSPSHDARIPIGYSNNTLVCNGVVRAISEAAPSRVYAIKVQLSGLLDRLLRDADYFQEIVPGVHATALTSQHHVDLGLYLPYEGLAYRTTLLKVDGDWVLSELSTSIADLGEDLTSQVAEHAVEMIVFGHREPMSPGELGFSTDIPILDAPAPAAPVVPADPVIEDLSGEVEGAQVEEDGGAAVEAAGGDEAKDDAVMLGALADEGESPRTTIVVDDVELSLDSSLSVLRRACQSLGIGKSGSKAVVFQRLCNQLLDKLKLIEASRATEVPNAPVPRVPEVPSEPTPEQRRAHNAVHAPFAPWCEHCVAFKSRDDAHRPASSDRSVPVISFDFGFSNRSEADGPHEKLTFLCIHVAVQTLRQQANTLLSMYEAEAKVKASVFRSCIGILMYVAADVPDLQHAIRMLSQYLAGPTEACMKALKHVVRYAKGTNGLCLGLEQTQAGHGVKVQCDTGADALELFTDSDWASDRSTRKSISAGALFMNANCIFTASRTQRVVAMSSCEAELNAMVSFAVDLMYVKEALQQFVTGTTPDCHVFSDSASARAVVCKQGLSKLKHVEIRLLWVQGALKSGAFKLHPIGTLYNSSDLMTKTLKRKRMLYLMYLLNIRDSEAQYGRVGETQAAARDNHLSMKLAIKAVKAFKGPPQRVHALLQALTFMSLIDANQAAELDSECHPHAFASALSGCAFILLCFGCLLDHCAWLGMLCAIAVCLSLQGCQTEIADEFAWFQIGFTLALGLVLALWFWVMLPEAEPPQQQPCEPDDDASPACDDDATSLNDEIPSSDEEQSSVPAMTRASSDELLSEPGRSSDDAAATDRDPPTEIANDALATVPAAAADPHAGLGQLRVYYAPISGRRWHVFRACWGLRQANAIAEEELRRLLQRDPGITMCLICRNQLNNDLRFEAPRVADRLDAQRREHPEPEPFQ